MIPTVAVLPRAAAAAAVLVLAALAAAQPAQYQVNSPQVSLDIDGAQNTAHTPMVVTRCTGQTYVLNLSTTLAAPFWDYAFTAPQIVGPLSGIGVASPGGQIVNIDLAAANFLLGLAFTVPLGNVSLPNAVGFPVTASAQMVVFDPTHPESFRLSAAHTLHVVSGANPSEVVIPGPSFNDGTMAIDIPCGYPPVVFAGTSWTRFFVNTNGTVTFGAGSTDATPTATEFRNGPPAVAGMWTDLNPGLGGSITITLSQFGIWHRVEFAGVPSAAAPGVANAFHVRFSHLGTLFLHYVPGAGHPSDTLVGFTPGGGATLPSGATASGGLSFLSYSGLGCQMGSATDAVFESTGGAAVPTGWTDIIAPNSDGTAWSVN